MERRSREPIVRSDVELKGGGRLDGVADLVDIRLERGELRWRRAAPQSLDVEGEVRAYLYVLEKGRREVEGKGLSIPFKARIDLPAGAPEEVEVYVDDLRSTHDFDPLSKDFQHRVTVLLAVAPKRGEGEAPPERPPLGSASGETRLSQVRLGERASEPQPELQKETGALPAASEERREREKTLVWKAFPPPIKK